MATVAVTLRVRAVAPLGYRLLVTGSVPEFGAWDLRKALVLEPCKRSLVIGYASSVLAVYSVCMSACLYVVKF